MSSAINKARKGGPPSASNTNLASEIIRNPQKPVQESTSLPHMNIIQSFNWKTDSVLVSDRNNNNGTKYKIEDLNVGFNRNPCWTVSRMTIDAGGYTYELISANDSLLYYVAKGECWFLIDKIGKPIPTGDFVAVEQQYPHQILNLSKTEDCVILIYYPGFIERKAI